jgi:hypothetical protein
VSKADSRFLIAPVTVYAVVDETVDMILQALPAESTTRGLLVQVKQELVSFNILTWFEKILQHVLAEALIQNDRGKS